MQSYIISKPWLQKSPRYSYLDLDIAVGLMSDELLGPFLEDFRFGEGSELNHDA